MNAVQEWSLVICAAALTAALAHGLVPNGALERMAKFVVGAFLSCAFLVPLTKIIPSFSLDFGGSEAPGVDTTLQSSVEDQMKGAARASITSLVAAELQRMQVPCKNVDITMDTTEDNSIVISKVVVTLPGEYAGSCENVRLRLTELLGLQTEVYADDGQGSSG